MMSFECEGRNRVESSCQLSRPVVFVQVLVTCWMQCWLMVEWAWTLAIESPD